MAETYTSKYANGEAVDAALDKAESALQAADVVNALDSTATTAPLSAAQGKALNDGKVTGPASATDNAIARFDGETGKLLQNGSGTLDDNANLSLVQFGPELAPALLDANWSDNAKFSFHGDGSVTVTLGGGAVTATGLAAEIGKLYVINATGTNLLAGISFAFGGATTLSAKNNTEQYYVIAATTGGLIINAASYSDCTITYLSVKEVKLNYGEINANRIAVGKAKIGQLLLDAGAYTSPSILFKNSGVRDNGLGIGFAGPEKISIVRNGNALISFSVAGIETSGGTSAQLLLENTLITRDVANTLAQRNGTNAQESRLYGSYTSATAYQRLATKAIREAVTCAAGASVTTTISIPKYTHLIGVTTRVTTALGTTNSTTGYTVGDGTDADLWGAITGTAQGTTSDRRDFTAVDALGPDGADRTITLTAVGGNFDGTGVIEVCAYYLAAEAD